MEPPVTDLSMLPFGVTTLAFGAVVAMLAARFARLVRRDRGLLTPTRFLCLSLLSLAGAAAATLAWGVGRVGFAACFGVGSVLGLVDPVISVCILVSVTLLRPWEVGDAPSLAVIPKISAAACVASWMIRGFRIPGGRGWTIAWSPPVKLFLAFAAWVFLNVLLKGDPETGLTLYSNTLLVSGILFLLVASLIRSEEAVRVMERTIGISTVGVIGAALLDTYGSGAHAGGGAGSRRLEGFGLLGNANDLAALIVLAVPLLAVPFLRRLGKMGKEGRMTGVGPGSLALLGGIAILLAGLWASESRGALIGLFCAGAAYLIARSRRPARGLLYGALLVPLLMGMLTAIKSMRQASDISESSESRLNYMLTGLNMAIHHPIMGVGFNNYPVLYESYAPSIQYEWGNRTAHSTWVLALAETGVPGFLLLAALFWVTLCSAWRARRDYPELLCSMTGYGVAMSFLSHTYTLFPYLVFSLVVGASHGGDSPHGSAGGPHDRITGASGPEAEARAIELLRGLVAAR